MARRGSTGTLVREVDKRDLHHQEFLENLHNGTRDLAVGLGLEGDSILHKQAHKRLADQVQTLAVMDAKLELKVTATMKAMKALASQMDIKRAQRAGGAKATDEAGMEHYLKQLSSTISSAMQGADEKAVTTKRYKDITKMIMAADDESDDEDIVLNTNNEISLICPITATTFTDPVMSRKCKHTYDKAAIANHIKVSRGGPPSCPIAGCMHKVTTTDLVPNKEVQRELRIRSQTEPVGPATEAEDADPDSIGMTYV